MNGLRVIAFGIAIALANFAVVEAKHVVPDRARTFSCSTGAECRDGQSTRATLEETGRARPLVAGFRLPRGSASIRLPRRTLPEIAFHAPNFSGTVSHEKRVPLPQLPRVKP